MRCLSGDLVESNVGTSFERVAGRGFSRQFRLRISLRGLTFVQSEEVLVTSYFPATKLMRYTARVSVLLPGTEDTQF